MQSYLGKELLKFSDKPQDIWRVDDAMKGTAIIGGTGSGKTSASGKAIAQKFLKEGWGGIVLCAKNDEAKLWEEYCDDAGRAKDRITFTKGSIHETGEFKGEEIIFNPIDYEMKREGEGAGETQNLTNIFMNIYKMGNRITGDNEVKEERYWDSALKRCLNRVIELLKLAREDLSYENMVKIITSAQLVTREKFIISLVDLEEGRIEELDEEHRSGYCLYCILKAYEELFKGDKEPEEELGNAFLMVEDYFTKSLPKLDEKTTAIIFESFLGLAEPFLAGILRRHFSGSTNLFPELTYKEQKIIILDFSIKEFLDMGIIGQCVFKQLFQQAIERRNTDIYPTPVFLWCDEAQYFVNPYDQIFLTTARSSLTATVFLSQNISNYFAIMGSGMDAKAKVNSLMGNLSTKIFHANSDAETNEYASRLIGNSQQQLSSSNQQHQSFSIMDNYSQGTSTQYLPQIQPKEFTTFKTGGEFNDYEVQGVVVVNGRKWSDGKNFIQTSFKQNFKN